MTTISLKTNQNRLIANLRHAFNQSSMLGELLQNARRAEASHIHFTVNDDSLSIRDDGIGIADLQSLIFIAESGWDETLKSRENAFGMGALSTLYFAERLTVCSGSQMFSAPTAYIISGEPIEVEPCDFLRGTEIRLDGVLPVPPKETLLSWVESELLRLCEAFPVPVWLNGKAIPRPLVDPALAWRETPMGKVLLDLSVSRTRWRCFLQGLPIGERPSYGDHHQVILLPDETLARLPDRQYLLNATEDHPRIQAAIDEAFREALIETRQRLAASDFVLHYARTCLESSNADLLNDLPFVPGNWFRDWDLNPAGFVRWWDHGAAEDIVAREALIEAGVWRIETGDDDDAPTAEVYLEARQAFLLQESKVDSGHWLMGLVRTITPEDIQVRHDTCLHRDARPELADYWVELELVDRLHVSLPGEPEVAVSAIRKGSTLYVTPDVHGVTELVSDYLFDDCYNEEREDEDRDTIATFIAVGCSSSPDRALLALLPWELRYTSQPKLAGAVVHLAFDSTGKLETVSV